MQYPAMFTKKFVPQVMPGILAVCLEQWCACTLTLWVLCTIHWGYQLQFLSCPTCFGKVITTSVSEEASPVLREEICVLLRKGAIQVVPQWKMEEIVVTSFSQFTPDEQAPQTLQVQNAYSTSSAILSASPGMVYISGFAYFAYHQSTQGTENSWGTPSKGLHTNFRSCCSGCP